MNVSTLTHHTQLVEWCDQTRLHKDPSTLEAMPRQARAGRLAPEKVESIGEWCTEVNRLFIQPPVRRPKQLFRKCKFSDSMVPPNKYTVRTPATGSFPSAGLWSSARPRSEVRSAVLTGKGHVRPATEPSELSLLRDDTNSALAMRMMEKSDYFLEERRTVHIHIQPEWKRKLSTGWTINRPLLYPKVPPPAPPENLLVDIPDYLVRNEDKRMEVSSEDSNTKKDKAFTSIAEHFDIPKIVHASEYLDDKDKADHENDSEKFTLEKDNDHGEADDDGLGNRRSQGTQWQPDQDEKDYTGSLDDVLKENNETEEAEHGEELTPTSKYCKPVISDRSTSNDILNVLSVDDCKMMLRYRPQRVIETTDTMILPPSSKATSTLQDSNPAEDSTLVSVPEEEEEVSSSPVSSNHIPSGSHLTPIRLSSQGSAATTLSPKQVQSRVHSYRKMYDIYTKRTPEAKVSRPSSAAVEKAFEVLLDKDFQACQSSRRPLSGPACWRKTPRPPSSCSSQASSHPPSARFLQLKATLRQHVYHWLDSRWLDTKIKFQRTKHGLRSPALKRARMLTSSPKQPGFSED